MIFIMIGRSTIKTYLMISHFKISNSKAIIKRHFMACCPFKP